MQNETNENHKNFIFSIKAAALIECVEDNAELGKAMRKLIETQPPQIAPPTETVNEVPEVENDENEIQEVTDPFNKAEPKVRDYVLQVEPDEIESESPFGNFTIDERGLPINILKPLKLKKGDYAFSHELKKTVEIEYGYWLEVSQENYYNVRFLDRAFYRFDVAESTLTKSNLEETKVTIKTSKSTYTVSSKPKVKTDKPSQKMPVFTMPPKEIVREDKPKNRRRKPVKSEPTTPPMFKIGQRVIYTPDNKWYGKDEDTPNPNIKIGIIVSLIWDAHYNEYKYYFANETETFSYLKQNCLLAVTVAQEQKIRIKLAKTNAPTKTETEIPSPKFKRGDIVHFINTTYDRKYVVRSTHYISSAKSFFYAVQSADGKFIYPDGYQIAEDKLELAPKETTQAHTPEAEPVAQEVPVKKKKTYTYKKVIKKTPTVLQNNAFRDFNEQFNFICMPYALHELTDIHYGLTNNPKKFSYSKKGKANSEAFFDMVMEQVNTSKLLHKDSRGYYKMYKFLNFNKIKSNNIVFLKNENTYTVTEYYRINPDNKTKKAYYRAETSSKKIAELAFYKKLFLLGYIDIERWRRLKMGTDVISPKEIFQTESIKLTFKKSTAKVYALKEEATKSIVGALLNKKIRELKARNKAQETVVKRKIGRPKKKLNNQ